ncbi:MAG: gliding motility-associated C-terminal domain-containing protein [Aureispira sp.]
MLKFYNCIWCFFVISTLFGQGFDICGDGIDNDGDGQIDEACQPFECDGSLYQSAKEGNAFMLYQLTVNPVRFNLVANLSRSGVVNDFNSLGYNPVDNLMYGMGLNDGRLYRVDATGAVEYMGNTGLSNFKNAGTFDGNNNYYVFGDNRMWKVNISNVTFSIVGGPGQFGSADIVFNALDNQIYGFNGNNPKLLFKIDPLTGQQTRVPNTAPLAINGSWGFMGSLYFNPQGNILAYYRTTIVKFDPLTGVGIGIGNGPSYSNTDGCSCSFAVEMTKEVTGNFSAGDTITYNFDFYNRSFNAVTNGISFADTLTNGLEWVSEPYNINGVAFGNNASITGNSIANLQIDSLPKGQSSFSIDVRIPCSYNQTSYTNQAYLNNLPPPLKSSILSDDPNTNTIGDATSFDLNTTPISYSIDNTPIICEQSTGTASVTATGGTGAIAYQWSTGAQTASINNLPAGNYTVSISDETGCVIEATTTIVEENIQVATFLTTRDQKCFKERDGFIQVDSSRGGYPPYQYALNGSSFGATTLFDGLLAGSYTLMTKDRFGCRHEVALILDAPLFDLQIEAPQDVSLRLGDRITKSIFQNTLTPVAYEWTPTTGLSCADCRTPILQALETTTYTIIGTDVQGCTDTTSWTVKVNESPRVFVPNAFSPNDDGLNDVLQVYSPGDVVQVLDFQIFSRWGERVFQQQNFLPNYPAYAWDGTFRGQKMPSGVFVYKLEVLLVDGRTEILSGDVTLFR